MPRFVTEIRYVCLFWMLISGLTKAQVPVHLHLNPVKIQKAAQLEKEAIAKHDSLILAEAYYLYGKAYVFVGDYRTAQSYYVKALRIQEPKGYSFELSRLYVRLSESENRLGRSTQALQYAYRSLKVAQHIRKDQAMALIRAYGALAQTYETIWSAQVPRKQSTFERTLLYYKKRELLCVKLRDTVGVAEVSLELGTLFSQVKDPRALSYLEKAQDLFTLKHKDGILVNTMVHLASAYLTFDKPEQAYQTLVKAESLYSSKKLTDYEIQLGLETQFVAYFEATRQWDKAFERLRKLNELERIRLLADRDGAITRLNMEYETEKKEALLSAQKKEIDLNAQNLRLQKYFSVVTFALFVIAAGMSVVFFRLYRKNQRISRRNEDLIKEQNHRVKNNLQVVSSLLSLQSKRLVDPTAKKAVEESRLRVQSMAILHQRLYDGERLAEVDLNDFIQELVRGVLKAYGSSAVTVHFAIDEIMLSANKAVPLGLILNELITNACKYAFPDNETPELWVICHRKGKKIELTVSDNGPGMDSPGWTDTRLDGFGFTSSKAIKTSSFGMQLIQAQVEQVNGTYQFSTHLRGTTSGVVFTMEFSV
ncbi:hypothetical protein EXU85_28320 [Spirosoma sp. KCTC 42546]|uniref:histidine kinase dimerization/phosphoacceptor domain -containing protein n=1 Tax=Spirosoma sp. KCTC 42546 TaxID=2520506 RepID=UPI00115900CF|nr:histidine kinase dimerization/phosphoacceptor domain -containing protein [Spirosoma sp. KCTC 42546]QDK82304.1 hypothetical protein EXU85_28320 [Spirosoma sp. KCTC 42546]